jgi:ABC-type multidrug transport system fused ATPase/permease subunit
MYFNQKLWSLTRGVRLRIAASVGMGLGGSILGISRLLLMGWLIAQVINGAGLEDVWLVAFATLALMVFYATWDYQRLMLAHNTAAIVQHKIRTRIFDQMVALGPSHFAHQRSGEVSSAAVEGVEQLEIYFGEFLPQLLVALLTPFVIFSVVAMLDLQVAFVLLIAALFTLLAPGLFHRWDTENSMRRARAYQAFASEFLDALQGLVTLKAFGQSKARESRLAEHAHELFRSTMWVLATNSLSRGITDIGIALGAAAALALSAYRVSHGLMEFESLIMVLLLGVEIFRPLRELRGLLHDGMLAESAARQVFSILESKPQIEDDSKSSTDKLEASLSFDQVGFAYDDPNLTSRSARGMVLDGLSFNIGVGERIGVVGSSGGGKSTIVRLLLRFYDPQSGVVRIGGKDAREIPLQQLRQLFAVVSQDTHLFHGTVRENLLLGDPRASEKSLVESAISANADEFIRALPDGYDTVIGERGVRLSGGQRQRLAIARALLRDAPILILDEALSSVDAQNEAEIQLALDRLMTGRTTLVLAHRLSSIIACDRILVLDRGHIAEQGRHDELMSQRGVYANLMGAQVTDRQAAEEGRTIVSEIPRANNSDEICFGLESTGASASRPVDLQVDVLQSDPHSWTRVFTQLLAFAIPWKGRLLATFALGVGRVLAFIGVSLLSALAAVAVKTGSDYSNFLIALAITAIVAALLHWLESWLSHDMAFRMLTEMRIALFRKLDSLAPAFLLRRRSGDLINLATHDVEMVEYFFAHTIAPVFVAALVPLLVLVLLASFDFTLALALLPFLALVALMPILRRAKIDRLAGRARELLGALSSHTVESLQGLGELLSYQASGQRRQQLVELMRRHHAERMPFFQEVTRQSVITDLTTVAAGLAIILLAVPLARTGEIDAVYMPLLALASMAAFLPLIEISDAGRQLAETFAATNRLIRVHDTPAAVSDDGLQQVENPQPLVSGTALDIEFLNLEFRYNAQDALAIRDFSLTIPAGSTVAIVGASGAGKSTLAQLLLRFWDPQKGEIRVGGFDLRYIQLAHLRQHVALVAQDTYLFNDSLRANLLMARPDASEADIMTAIERAQLGDFLARLPQGLDTNVGERGYALSGGQRQRVSIARAFLRDAPILILDEATSHLDALSEHAVHSALKELMQNRTTLVIAHRLATVRDADLIIVMREGRLIEQGTHLELLSNRAAYAGLLQFQMNGGPYMTMDSQIHSG